MIDSTKTYLSFIEAYQSVYEGMGGKGKGSSVRELERDFKDDKGKPDGRKYLKDRDTKGDDVILRMHTKDGRDTDHTIGGGSSGDKISNSAKIAHDRFMAKERSAAKKIKKIRSGEFVAPARSRSAQEGQKKRMRKADNKRTKKLVKAGDKIINDIRAGK